MSNNVIIDRLPPIERLQSPKPNETNAVSLLNNKDCDKPPKNRQLSPLKKADDLNHRTTWAIIQETTVGKIDSWPAHASQRGQHGPKVLLTRDKHLLVIDEQSNVGGSSSQLVPKPKFLQKLEEFLHQELRCLGVTSNEPSELRLQPFRQVFSYLIDDFKIYKPLLASIKNEYELMITHQHEEIQRLQPLQQMLIAVAEQCEQKILAIREQEKQEIKDLKAENRQLYDKIDELKDERVSLDEQVTRLEEELASQYLRYRDEYDARKLLIADVNELRYQQEEMIAARNAEAEGEKEDPVLLRIALKKAREDEALASQRLNEMIANYGDVIPRRDYEQLQKHYQILEDKLESLTGDFKRLKTEHETLLDVHKQVLQQRDDYYIEAETLRRSATPRPNWARCAESIAGGVEHWKQVTEGKSSEQMVDVLLAEIQGTSTDSDAARIDYFEGMGTGPEVPLYLQHEGQVRNRHVGRRDCLLLIHDIWRQKAQLDAQSSDGKRQKMSDFVHTYLKQTFGLDEMVIEWAYNLRYAAERFSESDQRIQLFWNVLSGEADEELYHSFLELVSQLLTELSDADVEKSGSLSRQEFTAVMTNFSLFRCKEAESILSLVRAAETDLGCKEDEPLAYQNLFMQDSEGWTGPFLQELRSQMEQERFQFIQDILDEIDEKSPVSVEEFRRAVLATDPNVDLATIDHCILWLFSDPSKPGELRSRELDNFTQRLRMCSVQRTGPKP